MKRFGQVLFLYHVKERELMINQMMVECLQRYELAEEIIIENFEEVHINPYRYSPDMIISFLPRVSYASDFLTLMKFVNNSIIIAIPTEGLMRLNHRKMEVLAGLNTYSTNLVDYYFFWGKSMAEHVGRVLIEQKKVRSMEQIQTFGYLPYEQEMIKKYRKNTAMVERILKIRNKYKKIVMFVTGFSGADITVEELCIEGSLDKHNTKEIERGKRKIRANKYYRDRYIDIVKESAGKYSDILFLLKLHPVEIETIKEKNKVLYNELRKYHNILIIDEIEPISTFLCYVDLFVHYGSTTALEAYIYKVPTIQLMNDHKDVLPDSYGTDLFDSTRQIVVSDSAKFCAALREEIPFIELKRTAKILGDLMNYKTDSAYVPSQILSHLFCNASLNAKLSISDIEVRKALIGKSCILLYGSLIKRVFLYGILGNLSESKLILRWLMCLVKKDGYKRLPC